MEREKLKQERNEEKVFMFLSSKVLSPTELLDF